MPRSSRLSLAVLVSLLAAVLLAFPSLSVGCAQGEPKSDPIAAPTATQPPIEQPVPVPTATAPKPPVNPDEAMTPVVASVTPNKGTVGAVGPSIIVSGTNFVARSIVQLDGAPLATTFVSGTELRATIPTSKLAAVGVLRISVGTSPPGGGVAVGAAVGAGSVGWVVEAGITGAS